MSQRILPRKILYGLMVLLIVVAFLHVITDIEQFLYVAMLLGGLVGIIRPKILLEFIQEEKKNGTMDIDPLFSEEFYRIIGLSGGIILILISIAKLIFPK